jgi:hypothetical protein
MRHYRQIILLFFLSSIVNIVNIVNRQYRQSSRYRQAIVKVSSRYRQGIVNRQSSIVNRQGIVNRQSSIVKPRDPRPTGVQEIGRCPKKWTVSRKLDSTVSKKMVMYRILVMYRIIEWCTKNNTQI